MAKKTDNVENPVIEETTAETVEIPAETADVTAPTKRKRGRPSKAEHAASAADKVGASPVSSAPRGRKPGRKARPEFSAEARVILAAQIEGLHKISAMATGIPELMLSRDESVMLADAMANVAQEYGLSLSGKTGALLQFAGVAAFLYAPRFFAVNDRVRKAKAARDAATIINEAGAHVEAPVATHG